MAFSYQKHPKTTKNNRKDVQSATDCKNRSREPGFRSSVHGISKEKHKMRWIPVVLTLVAIALDAQPAKPIVPPGRRAARIAPEPLVILSDANGDYCRRAPNGQLLVLVRNRSGHVVSDAYVHMAFSPAFVPTTSAVGTLAPGQVGTFRFWAPAGCGNAQGEHCAFRIRLTDRPTVQSGQHAYAAANSFCLSGIASEPR